MAGFDYATAATPILKEVYLPQMQELLNNATPLLKMIEKSIQPVEGGNFVFSVHRGRNGAAAVGRAEDATLPTAEYQGYVRAIVPVRRLYSRIRVSGQAIAATKSNKGSFVRAIESEMKGSMTDTKRELNRQLNGDGTGALAYWTAADNVDNGANTAVDVDDNLGNNNTHLPVTATSCDLVDASNHLTLLNTGILSVTRGAASATTTAITAVTGTVAGSADGDYLIKTGSVRQEMVGIQAIVSNANPLTLSGGLHGLPIATYPDWVAQVLGSDAAASRQDLSFDLMQQLLSKIISESAIDEREIKLWHCHPSVRDAYLKLCRDERIVTNQMELDGGWKTVAYNGKPIAPDVQCRRNALFAITPSSLALFQMAPLDWMDKDGSVFYRISGGDVDAYGATAFVYQELGCKARNQNGVLLGINDIWV
jgi:hypothetical protein